MNRRALAVAATALFALTIAAVAAWRMFYGVDFADEGFYVAMPYTFALGNQPFVNELALQQTAALLVTPFTRAYVALRGSEGIVLFFRELFLLLALLTGWAIFRLARVVAGVPAALLVATLPFLVVPGIASISYNSLGMNLLCAGACLAAHGVLRRSRASLLLAGPALLLAAFAYPTMVFPAGVCLIAAAVRVRSRWLVYPALGTGVLLFAWVASFGWDNVATSFIYMTRHAGHGGDVAGLWKALLSSAPYSPVLLAALGVAVVTTLLLRRAWVGLALTVALLAAFRQDGDWRVVSLMVFYGTLVLVPGVWWAHRTHRTERTDRTNRTDGEPASHESYLSYPSYQSCFPVMATVVVLPGLVAAVVMGWTSSNGFPNAGLGAYTAFVGLLILALAIPWEHGGAEVALAVAALLVMMALFIFRYVYREEPLSRLTARIPSGPYAGLYTTPDRRDFVARLARDVARYGGRVLFHDSFPAGYLFTSTRPPIETTWIPYAQDFPAFDRTWYTSYYHRPENQPGTVFEVLSVPTVDGGLLYQISLPRDPMHHAFWRSGYQVVEANPFYAIHRRCETCVTDVLEAETLIDSTGRPAWREIAGNYSGGALAATTRRGATLRGTIPRFRPGPYRVDFSLYRNTRRTHEVRISLGDEERRVVVGREAPFRISRAIGVVFPNVETPEITIEVESSGKGAILLDEIAISRAPTVGLLAGECSYCQIGPVQRRPITFEPETAVTLDRDNLEDRKRVRTDWIRVRHARYSGGAAVMTAGANVLLRGRITRLQPGDYEVTVSVVHPGPGYAAAFRLTLGGVSRILQTDPSLPRGSHDVKAVFPGVRGNQLTLTATNPGKPSLMVDKAVIKPER